MRKNLLRPSDGILIQNDAASTIPPRSVVVTKSLVTTTATSVQEAETTLHVEQYTSTKMGLILVTGEAAILSGGTGVAYFDDFLFVSIDDTVASPLQGEQWGPIPNKWAIGRGGMGFFCVGYSSNGGVPARAIFKRKEGYYFGKLASTLSAGSLSSPSNATFNVWHPNPAASGPGQAMIVSPNSGLLGQSAYNYSASNAGSAGYDCVVQMTSAGLTFVSVGCKTS